MLETNDLGQGTYEIVLGKTFDFEIHKDFREHIKDALTKNPRKLVLNFANVEYIDSSGIGLVQLTKTECDKHGCEIVLSSIVNPHVKKVLDLVKFTEKFKVE